MSNYQSSNYSNSCSSACSQNRSGEYASCPVRGRCGCSRMVCGICSLKAAAFFAILLALAVGIILGAVYAEIFFPALAAIIVFVVIMAVAVIALLLYRGCEC